MKRDIDLIRTLLFYVEKNFDPAEGVLTLERHDPPKELCENCSTEELLRHAELLWEAGLLNIHLSSDRDDLQRTVNGNATIIPIRGLTHEGHDFLDNIRDDSTWNSVKEETRTLALDVVKAVAEGAAKGAIGI